MEFLIIFKKKNPKAIVMWVISPPNNYVTGRPISNMMEMLGQV